MKRTTWVGLLVVGYALFSVSPALAQNTDGAFRLSLDGIVFAGEFGTFTPPAELGAAGDRNVTSTTAGLYAGSFGVGLAYAFNRNGVIGARMLHGSNKSEVAGEAALTTKTSQFTLLPYGEYVIDASSTVHPFFSGSIGFQNVSSESGGAETSTNTFLFGLSAGLHLFPTDTFSIDPYFAYYRAGGSASLGTLDVDYSAHTVLLGFSISGWMGGAADGKEAVTVGPAEAQTTALEPQRPTSESVATETEARAPSARLKLVEDDELLSGALALGSGQLTLLGKPTVDAENVVVRVTATGGEAKLQNCRTGALLAGDHRFSLREMIGRTRLHGSTTFVALQGTLGTRELSTFTEYEDARIVLCGRIFPVHAGQRESIGQYFEHFRELAMEAGTWEKSVPPSGAGQGSETAPAQTVTEPPASQPVAPPPPVAPSPTPPPAKPAPGSKKTAPMQPPPSGSAPPTGSFETP